MTNERNLMAGLTEYQATELKNNVDKIKKIFNINPDPSYVFYYVTVSGNHRIITLKDDFSHITKYNATQKTNIINQIDALDFKFVFKNEDSLKIELDDFDSIDIFLTKEKFNNQFQELNNSRLLDKVVLVLYEKM